MIEDLKQINMTRVNSFNSRLANKPEAKAAPKKESKSLVKSKADAYSSSLAVVEKQDYLKRESKNPVIEQGKTDSRMWQLANSYYQASQADIKIDYDEPVEAPKNTKNTSKWADHPLVQKYGENISVEGDKYTIMVNGSPMQGSFV